MAIENYVTHDYVANYAEANRRRPTHVTGPLISSYIAIYYPGDFEKNFAPFIKALLQFIGYHGDESATAKGIFERLNHNAKQSSPDEILTAPLAPDKGPADFIFEEPVVGFERGTWRLEIHREYVAITLFLGLDIIDLGDSISYRIATANGFGVSSPPLAKTSSHHRKLLAALYRRFPKTVDEAFKPLEAVLEDFWNTRTRRRSPRIFARLYGATVPWTALAVGLTTDQLPHFPDRASSGFRQNSAQPYTEPTDRFLRAIWHRGITRHLLGGSDHDSVACFVQNGHGLYVSDLGHRTNLSDKSPLKYLLMYADQDGRLAAPVEPTPVRSIERGTENSRPPTQFSWRLSRLVGRLHDLGGTRLAALRNQHSMMMFSQKLRAIEKLLQSGDPPSHESIVEAEHQLQHAAKQVGEPIAARSYRTANYFDSVRSLSDDLGVVTLPSYQPYTHFVRRRLFSQMRYLSGIGARHERLLERIQAIYNSHVAREILSIQRLADVVGAVIMIHYSMEIVEQVFQAYEKAKPFFATFVKHPWPLRFPSETEQAHGFWVLAVGAGIYLAMAGRVAAVVKTWRPDWMTLPWLRPSRGNETREAAKRRRGRERPFQYLFACLILGPFFLLTPWNAWPVLRDSFRAWEVFRFRRDEARRFLS